MSPAELVFGRKLRSRLDLFWPGESLATRVADKQQSRKDNHSLVGRSLTITPGSPISIRNYSTGPKWIPARVQSQTGPLSYRCQLQDGGVAKRHQDQIITRQLPSNSNTTPEPRVTSAQAVPQVDPT